jgi:pyruvate,water dikinase
MSTAAVPGHISTGTGGLDAVVDGLRLGDNVVWQVDAVEDYRQVVDAFVARTLDDGRRLVYVRFGDHEPLVDDPRAVRVEVDASEGFERFATAVHDLVTREGAGVFYVFDTLTDLLRSWRSDLMIANFFRIACPYLYELDTVAYFALRRDEHTYGTVASIRETTQLLLDLYRIEGRTYVHPLKVWQRYSPTMFFPNLIDGDEAVCITASAEAAQLFSRLRRPTPRRDPWTETLDRAHDALTGTPEQRAAAAAELRAMIISGSSRMAELAARYFTLEDLLTIASRELGTGFVGGKSVGMLLARRILERDGGPDLARRLEPHDSYYVGSDVFYTYIVQNGWWALRARQRTREGFLRHAPELREKLLHGVFPAHIREQFMQMLEYFGQSPIIVRSSSLLEDDFGNAFAGKYDSVWCVNQGTPEERLRAFENAVRQVYASAMSTEALEYRAARGLVDRDEQMAILVQRVSGDRHGEDYFPHMAGVGNSQNLYIWDPSVDADAGMVRLVLGLGTRAVDRTVGDYAKIVCLDDPLRLPPMSYGDEKKYSQRGVDVLSLTENSWRSRGLEEVLAGDLKADPSLFARVDETVAARARERGRGERRTSHLLDFRRLLAETEVPAVLREILATVSAAYAHPVDVEFTVNLLGNGDFRVSVLQCRPLQTRGLGAPVPMPADLDPDRALFVSEGRFMGGNVRIPLDRVVAVRPAQYLDLDQQDRYEVARTIGRLTAALRDESLMLLGPGRWGTTTPALGVPVRFSEIAPAAVLAEFSAPGAGFMPELSYGSHFFQDLVESGIFYVALFDGEPGVTFHPEMVWDRPNELTDVLPEAGRLSHVLHVVSAPWHVASDVATQRVVCL